MKKYQELLTEVLENGVRKGDRTGTGTISVFGAQTRFNLQDGFPLVTTKKMFTKGIIAELLWFLEGSTDERRLAEIQYGMPREELIGKNTIWTANADAQGKALGYKNTDTVKELGPVYGRQWRSSRGFKKVTVNEYNEITDWGPKWSGSHEEFKPFEIDQIAEVIESIKNNPNSRRHIVSAWNVAEIDQMTLPPCHTMFQFYVAPLSDAELEKEIELCGEDCKKEFSELPELTDEAIIEFSKKWRIQTGKLSCQLYQRSADLFLGVPYNISSYALLTMMIAQVCDLKVGDFVHTFGDLHLYSDHIDQAKEQLSRTPHKLPTMNINPAVRDINDFKMSDFELLDYECDEAIKARMAV